MAHFRTDIQGLRAVAVLIVFADHLFGWPGGGFLGVDVFFVISGFLITGLLLREYEKTGHISFRSFYVGRLKRIVPAATVVLIFTIAFSWALFTQQRAISVSWDAFWAFLSGANWNFAIAGTDYFQQGTAVSPLQHYWSLSVEEQFYFVWPWLVLGLLVLFAWFVRITEKRARLIAGSAIGIIVVVSFGGAMIQSTEQPTAAYFSTFTRAWELGSGALLAIAAPFFVKMPSALRPVMAYIGLLGIIVSCFVITPTTVWPAPGALVPVVATVLVIASGIGKEARFLFPLTNPVSVFVGNISYGLYLWHFPMITLGRAYYPDMPGSLVYIGIVAVGFAVAQYYAIERPIWKSPLWAKTGPRTWKQWWFDHEEQIRFGGLGGLVTFTLAVAGVAFLPVSAPAQSAMPVPTPARSAMAVAAPVESATPASPARTAVSDAVAAAVSASRWPALTPSLNEIGPNSKVDAWVKDGCLALYGTNTGAEEVAARCVYGSANAEKTAVLFGDSIATSWLPAVQAALPGWRIDVWTAAECPAASVSSKRGDGSPFPECAAFRDWVVKKIGETKPELVLVSQSTETLKRLTSKAVGDMAVAELTAGLETTVSMIAPNAGKVAVLDAPPAVSASITECATSVSTPASCLTSYSGDDKANAKVAADAVAGVPNAIHVETVEFFCAGGGQCPAFADGIIMRPDKNHLTQEYSKYLGPALGEALSPAITG